MDVCRRQTEMDIVILSALNNSETEINTSELLIIHWYIEDYGISEFYEIVNSIIRDDNKEDALADDIDSKVMNNIIFTLIDMGKGFSEVPKYIRKLVCKALSSKYSSIIALMYLYHFHPVNIKDATELYDPLSKVVTEKYGIYYTSIRDELIKECKKIMDANKGGETTNDNAS